MLLNTPGFETKATPTLIDEVRALVYPTVAKACSNYRGSRVCVARIYRNGKTVKSSTPKTYECHNVIKEAFDDGGTAIFTQRQTTVPKGGDRWADYYVNRSPYAPFIWSTAKEYIDHGIIISSDVPANFMASACIGSRLICRAAFLRSFTSFLDIGMSEAVATLLGHWLAVNDKSVYVSHSGDHGLFYYSKSVTPGVVWSWLRGEPYYKTKWQFSEDTSNSTYGGVYALWDGVTSGDFRWPTDVRRSTNDALNLEQRITSAIKKAGAKPAVDSGLNPFMKAVAFITKKESEKTITNTQWAWNDETKSVLFNMWADVERAANSMTEQEFIDYWKGIGTVCVES